MPLLPANALEQRETFTDCTGNCDLGLAQERMRPKLVQAGKPMVDVNKYQIFIVAAETENFSTAAYRLGLSQPAISFRIQSLESELKVKLFERVGKRVVLTEVGRELLPMARELIHLATTIEENVGAWRDTVQGPLHLGCGTNLAKHVLPYLIGAFNARYPLVRVNCVEMNLQAIGDKLVEREIHLGVVDQQLKGKKLDYDPLFTDECVLVVATSHPWAMHSQVLLAELREATWIFSEADMTANSLPSARLRTLGISPEELKGGTYLGDAEATLAMVEAGQGVAFVSRLAAHQSIESRRIRVIQVERMSPLHHEIDLVYFKKGETRVQRHFREFIESAEGQSLIAKYTQLPQEQ